jgi:hypothetical protein
MILYVGHKVCRRNPYNFKDLSQKGRGFKDLSQKGSRRLCVGPKHFVPDQSERYHVDNQIH